MAGLGEDFVTHNWVLYIAAFMSAFAISLVTTPFAKRVSFILKAIDRPKARGMHKKNMPRMGGIAIVLGFTITVVILSRFITDLDFRQFAGLLAGALIIACESPY